MFSKKDSVGTVDASKKILEDIRPVDNGTIEEIIEDQFIPIDDRMQQELKDDDYLSFESEVEDDFNIENFNKKTYQPVDNRTTEETIEDQFIPIDDKTQQELKNDDYLSFESEVEDNKVTIEDDFDIDNFNKKTYRPVDNRTVEEIIDYQFILIDDRTQQELEDDDYQSFESENEIENIDLTSAWNDKKTTVSKPGPIFKLSTGYNRKIRTASKIKSKYLKKKIGQREKSNKISPEWLKTAGYLNTKDQDKINYMFVSPKKETAYNIPSDAGHFLRTEIDSTDL